MTTDTTRGGAPAAAPETKPEPSTSAVNALALAQATIILGEIAQFAATFDRFCYFQLGEFDGSDVMSEKASLTIEVLRSMTLRAGWLADLALKKLTGREEVRGTAEDWLICPVYPKRDA